jgi:hypothetical protein
VESAFDEDRVGWAPPLSALGPAERIPARYASLHGWLQWANVRWVLSYFALPEHLVALRDTVAVPELVQPLRLYEVKGVLPRAYRSPSGAATYERIDAHTIRLRSSGPAGLIVLAEGYHRHWRAEGPEGRVPISQMNGRSMAFATPGGERSYTLRYDPPWRRGALGLSILGALLTLLCLSHLTPQMVSASIRRD